MRTMFASLISVAAVTLASTRAAVSEAAGELLPADDSTLPIEPPHALDAAATVAQHINERFANGHPSEDLALTGVVVHQSDSFELGSYAHQDRLAASIINHKLPYLWSRSAVGFVLRPSDVQTALRCSYSRDGYTDFAVDGGCSATRFSDGHRMPPPPQLPFDANQTAAMLEAHLADVAALDQQSLTAGHCDLRDRSYCRYNELVISAQTIAAKLRFDSAANRPSIVEAVFVPMNTPVDHVEGDMAQARELARALSVPLLAFDYKELASGRGPFAVV